jgi:hypothetical protein
LLLLANAFEHNKSDVIELFTQAELPDIIYDFRQETLRRQRTMPPQRVDQALFAEFFFCGIERFSDAVGVDCQGVP